MTSIIWKQKYDNNITNVILLFIQDKFKFHLYKAKYFQFYHFSVEVAPTIAINFQMKYWDVLNYDILNSLVFIIAFCVWLIHQIWKNLSLFFLHSYLNEMSFIETLKVVKY